MKPVESLSGELVFRMLVPTCLGLLLGLPGCSSQPPPEPLVVGHLTRRLTNDAGSNHARQGMILAVEDAVREEARPWGRRIEIHHLEVADEENAPAHETIRLLTVNRAIGLLSDLPQSTTGTILRAARPYGVPLVTLGTFTGPSDSQVFSLQVSAPRRGAILARFAAEDLKAKHALVIRNPKDAEAVAISTGFAREFAQTGGRRCTVWNPEDDKDPNSLVARNSEVKPDIILFADSVRALAEVQTRLPGERFRMPLLFAGDTRGELEELAPFAASEDIYTLETFFIDDTAPRAREFAQRYRERFRSDATASAAAGFENASLLFEAIRQTEPGRWERVRETLASLEGFEGLTGPITLDREHHHARRPLFLLRGDTGRFRLVKRIEVEAQ